MVRSVENLPVADIKVGSGVCGTAVSQKKTQLVPNVHEFPGHIACDGGSNSEIVVPIFLNDEVIGVIDLDGYELGPLQRVGTERFGKDCPDALQRL